MAQEQFELDKLKNDPDLWKRLCAYNEKTGQMEHLFKDKENPFTRGGDGPMNRIREVAEKGNLYMREHGRARHFRKADLEENQLKLGDMREAKLSRTSDPFMTGLLWATRGYLRWIGINWAANWLDKRMQKRAERRQEDLRYREEFDSLSDDQKKDMKKLRKEEKKAKKEAEKAAKLAKKQEKARIKQQKKIEKLAKALEKAQQQMNKLEGKPVTTKEEPKTAPKKQEKKKVTKKKKPKTNEKTKKKVKVKPKEKTNQQQIELQEFPLQQQQPPEQQIQQPTEQTQQIQQPTEQTQPEQTQQQLTEAPLIDNDEPAVTGNLIDTEAFPQTVTNDNVPTFDFTAPIEQQIDGNAKEVHMDNLVERPPDLDENKVSMQPNEMENQTNLREQLAKEKQQLDAVTAWRDTVAKSLFSHEQGNDLMEDYKQNLNNKDERSDYLTGVVYGILGGNIATQEQRQDVMNKLLNGEQLGNEYDGLIREGINTFSNVANAEDNESLKNLIANAMGELSDQASREESFSLRHAMIGRLVSNGAEMANKLEIQLPFNEAEKSLVKGASRMGTIAQNYYNARQYLGNNPEQINTESGKKASDYLLAGNAVKQMFTMDKQEQQKVSATQHILSSEMWSPESMKTLISNSKARRKVDPEGIKSLLEKPDSLDAFKLGKKMSREILVKSMAVENEANRNLEMQNVANLDNAQPQINPLANATH